MSFDFQSMSFSDFLIELELLWLASSLRVFDLGTPEREEVAEETVEVFSSSFKWAGSGVEVGVLFSERGIAGFSESPMVKIEDKIMMKVF